MKLNILILKQTLLQSINEVFNIKHNIARVGGINLFISLTGYLLPADGGSKNGISSD